MFHFCTFFFFFLQFKQCKRAEHTHKGKRLLSSIVQLCRLKGGKSLPAVCKSRKGKVVVSLKCWRKCLRRNCLFLSQGCPLCPPQVMAPRWKTQLVQDGVTTTPEMPEMPTPPPLPIPESLQEHQTPLRCGKFGCF